MRIQNYVSLANFTTWRVGGPADWLAEPNSLEETQNLINWSKQKNIPCEILGAGSNLLISDSGVKGLIICMRKLNGSKFDPSSGLVQAWGGEPLPTLARLAAKQGFHGLEWAIGIPGTIGGAIVMNAGAQSNCIANWLESVQLLDLDSNKLFVLKKKELNFGYRQSRLQEKQFVVISARFKLEAGHNIKNLTEKTNKNLNHRLQTQPYHLPSCGSVFRNPDPLKAGTLIEELGLKGVKIGGAEISTTHANFIINNGNATAKDLKELIALIQKRVKEKHGFMLHPEVKELGFRSKP